MARARGTTVRLEGVGDLARDLRRVAAQARAGMRRAVADTAGAVADGTRQAAPVRTGALRADVDVATKSGGLAAEVGYDDAEYGAQVELGTSDTPAQPALGPAAERERPRFPQRVAREVRREIGT